MHDERTARAVQLTNRGTDRVTAVALARDVLRSSPSESDAHHCLLVLTRAGELTEPPRRHTSASPASALLDGGQHDEALEVLLSSDASAEHLFERGRLNQAQGHHDRAYADFMAAGRAAEAGGITNPAVLPWRSAAALSAHDAGRPVVARSLAESALVAARRWGAPPAVGRALHAVALTGDPDRAVDHLTTAVHLLSTSPTGLMPARHNLAQALATQGRHVEAARTCATTQSIARRFERPLWIQRTSELGERLGRLSLLTPQESRTAKLACTTGNREIAAELGVTTRTVELHLSQVYRKLHVKGRRELNQVILRLGVTPP